MSKQSENDGTLTGIQEKRERLGRRVREVWEHWAREQPNCKPSWVVPWEQLTEPEREVDRRIAMAIAGDVIDSFAGDIAQAVLYRREHPEDGSEPANIDWMKSICELTWDGILVIKYRCGDVAVSFLPTSFTNTWLAKIGTPAVANWPIKLRTRDEIRRLCRALNLPNI